MRICQHRFSFFPAFAAFSQSIMKPHPYKEIIMLNPKQTALVAALGLGFVAQAAGVARFAYSAFALENQAKTLLDLANKHADKLDEMDLQAMRNVGLIKE